MMCWWNTTRRKTQCPSSYQRPNQRRESHRRHCPLRTFRPPGFLSFAPASIRPRVRIHRRTHKMSATATLNDLNSLIAKGKANVYYNLSVGALVEQSLRRGETHMASNGAIVGATGKRTGRSPKDKFIVKDAITADKVNWGSNQEFTTEKFDALYNRVLDYLGAKDIFVQQLFAGADPAYRLPVQI